MKIKSKQKNINLWCINVGMLLYKDLCHLRIEFLRMIVLSYVIFCLSVKGFQEYVLKPVSTMPLS